MTDYATGGYVGAGHLHLEHPAPYVVPHRDMCGGSERCTCGAVDDQEAVAAVLADARRDAIKALRDEATRLRREGIDWQTQDGCTTEGAIAAAHLCAASGRLLATARRLEKGAES